MAADTDHSPSPDTFAALYELVGGFNKTGAALTPETRFSEDLNFDSLVVMEFVAEVEDRFDISVRLNLRRHKKLPGPHFAAESSGGAPWARGRGGHGPHGRRRRQWHLWGPRRRGTRPVRFLRPPPRHGVLHRLSGQPRRAVDRRRPG